MTNTLGNTTQDATQDAMVASARDLTKTYGRGATEVHALRGLDIDLATTKTVLDTLAAATAARRRIGTGAWHSR